MITPEQLEEWKRLAYEASIGPWIVEAGNYSGNDWLIGSIYLGTGNDMKNYSVHITTDHVHASQVGGGAAEDAAFIAASREAVPALIAEVDRLNAEIARLKEQA